MDEDKKFNTRVLQTWGTIGLVVYKRSKLLSFDRKMLVGQASNLSMSKFSLGVSLEEIEREIAKALSACFKRNTSNSRDVYVCLKMIDRILPQNLPKMMNQVLNKHFS